MYNVVDFVRWALLHVDPDTIPANSVLARPSEECGLYPAHYLFGSVWKQCTPSTIKWYWDNHYKKTLYSQEVYDNITSSWSPRSYATDCQGLCDAYLTVVCKENTDINSHTNYKSWCTEKAKITDTRPFVIGEAVFMKNKKGKIHHVGFICGFSEDKKPLAVEARSLVNGVVITRVCDRPWTHRGLMTKKFYYGEPQRMLIFKHTKPMATGDPYRKMQEALNGAGYTDANNNSLDIDGKWGAKSQQAFDSMIAAHAAPVAPPVVDNRFHEIMSFAEGKVTAHFYGKLTIQGE